LIDAEGKPTSAKWLKQSAPGDGLFYAELTEQETVLVSSRIDPLNKVLHTPGILPKEGEEISKEILIARITKNAVYGKICGRDRAKNEIIPLLIDDGYLEPKEVPRKKVRPEIRFVRTKKKPGKLSFRTSGQVSTA